MSFIALVDCNNFFVSCERVFSPELRNRPVAILSNNDGCIIARSEEVKVLGIPMGAPLFQWKEVIEQHRVIIRSSNFCLYADMSQRVMSTLAYWNPEMEIYSIDEAFLTLPDSNNLLEYCQDLRQKVLQWTGIPVSIGIAPTKTLAKVANHCAKKGDRKKGVHAFFTPEEIDTYLEKLPVKEVWGIGRRLTLHLQRHGIHTAAQFRNQDDLWIQNHLTVTGLRTAWELRGIPCFLPSEEPASKKSMMTSRSFGNVVTDKDLLKEAVATFAANSCEKVREEGTYASFLQIFVMTSKDYDHFCVHLPEPTQYTPHILHYALKGVDHIFKKGAEYKKAGVLLGGLVASDNRQLDLFSKNNSEKEEKVMGLMDLCHQKYGKKGLFFAAMGTDSSWHSKRSLCSPSYTTNWDAILTVTL